MTDRTTAGTTQAGVAQMAEQGSRFDTLIRGLSNHQKLCYCGFKPSMFGFYKDEFVNEVAKERHRIIYTNGINSLLEE